MDLKYFNRDKKSESSYPLTAYYQANFSKQELKDIAEITDSTASLFGYL